MKSSVKKIFLTLLLVFSLPLLLLAAKTVIDLRKGAQGSMANLIIDANRTQGLIPRNLWQNLSQGGEESLDMIKPVLIQTRALSPQIIRLDHLFDYYQIYQGPDNYDFSRLDQSVNTILLTGAIPLLSLSYTPASLAKNGQTAGEPADWDQWFKLIHATARHYSVDLNIKGIYYEVWNEPDLFGNWHYSRSPSYSTLYSQTARAVDQAASGRDYKIGGPATTAFYPNWIKSLLNLAQSDNLRLDFISWHRYSKDINDYRKDIEQLNSLLIEFPQFQNIEKIITEIGPNPEPDAWYDNQLSGLHLLSLATQLSGQVNRLFTFEIVDGPASRNPSQSSGWGLMTHPSQTVKLKPRYFALQFLNRLNGRRLYSIGNGSWVSAMASKNNDIIQILLVNYDPRQSHVETVPLTINNITPGPYQLKTTVFQGRSSNRTITISSSVYTDQIYLDANTAQLIELTPVK